MAKISCNIGYAALIDQGDGVFIEDYTVVHYRGDFHRNTRKLQSGDGLNDNINVSNEVSIVADAFAINNIQAMRWIEWMGAKWKITDVQVQRPRLILTIGGVYNAETSSSSSGT